MTDTPKTCCSTKPDTVKVDEPVNSQGQKLDYIYVFCVGILTVALLCHFILPDAPFWLHHFVQIVFEILATMWWGVLLGIVIVGVMGKVPRDYFIGMMGKDNSFSGLLRAAFGGVVLDVCCHGVLLIVAKLYERGVSLPQVMTFLVASPWNSVSLMLVLITLIGFKWTMLYIIGSAVISLLTGLAFQALTRKGYIPANPHTRDVPDNFKVHTATMEQIRRIRFSKSVITDILRSGWSDGKMIVKWLLLGTIIAAASRTFIPHDTFSDWFGPTLAGLFFTVILATVLEICSEGSAPMASEFVTQAGAPGNGFAFLMAGVSTDYTEILAIRQFTGSWKIALCLPLVTVPQVIFLAWLMNIAAH